MAAAGQAVVGKAASEQTAPGEYNDEEQHEHDMQQLEAELEHEEDTVSEDEVSKRRPKKNE